MHAASGRGGAHPFDPPTAGGGQSRGQLDDACRRFSTTPDPRNGSLQRSVMMGTPDRPSTMTRHFLRILAAAVLVTAATRTAHAQRPGELAPNAPTDRPVGGAACILDAMRRAMAPYVEQARTTWPAARDRFRAGLPPHHSFFVATRLHDAAGREEQVFIAVDSIAGDTIHGTIASQIGLVQGYRYGQRYSFPDSELVDWMVARPDGSEEGNVVGKFIDTYTPPKSCS